MRVKLFSQCWRLPLCLILIGFVLLDFREA
jgi:hypothetical protein